MVSGDLQSADGEQHPCPGCGPFRKWEPDDIEADLVKKTNLSSYVQLKSKHVEPDIREKVFDDCRDRWLSYTAANLATLHGIGAAKYFLDRIEGLKPAYDILLLRFYVPAFFTGLTASLDCLAIEIHLLVCLDDPYIDSLRQVSFNRLGKKLECAAQCKDPSECAIIDKLMRCVVDSCDAKKLRDEAFKWRHGYAHRSVVFSVYDVKGSAYLFDPNMQPGDIEKWVPPISPADRALLAETGRPMLPLLGEYWQSARQIINESWSVMAEIVDVRMKG